MKRRERDLLEAWADHVVPSSTSATLRPLKVVADTANGMGGLVVPDRLQAPALRDRDPLPRARRDLPQPPGRPDPAREPGGPQGGGARARGRHRPRLRRGRRPRLPGRRAGRARLGLAHHGAGGGVHAATSTPGRRSSTTSSARRSCPRSIAEHGRVAGADPGRALHHQAGHGRDRRRLRWRALGPLLLPGQLPGRLGDHHRAHRPRAALAERAAALRDCSRPYHRYADSGEINTEVASPRRHRGRPGGARSRRRRVGGPASTG